MWKVVLERLRDTQLRQKCGMKLVGYMCVAINSQIVENNLNYLLVYMCPQRCSREQSLLWTPVKLLSCTTAMKLASQKMRKYYHDLPKS